MRWFGRSWGARFCAEAPHMDTPIGLPCSYCAEPFVAGDRGVVHTQVLVAGATRAQVEDRLLHLECEIRCVVGGVHHQQRQCCCFGGALPADPAGMSRRQAARAACIMAGVVPGLPPVHESRSELRHD